MLGQAGAIAKLPPTANGALDDGQPDPTAVQDPVAITSVSTAATAVLATGIPMGGCWVTFSVDTDCYIVFGPSAAGTPAASASNGWPIAANTERDWRVNEKRQFFRVIRKTADGVLKRYKSEQ